MLQIHHFPANELAKQAAAGLHRLLQTALNRPRLLLLSGGSAFRLLPFLPVEILDEQLTLGMIDERFATESTVNNFAQLVQLPFFEDVLASGCGLVDTRPQPGEQFAAFTSRYAGQLRDWHERHPQGEVIATLGMGPDGHTAGIFPFPDDPKIFQNYFEETDFVVGYDAAVNQQHPLRSTVTLRYLRQRVMHTVVYIQGDEKRQAFGRLSAPHGTLSETPARIFHELPDVQLFTDLQ